MTQLYLSSKTGINICTISNYFTSQHVTKWKREGTICTLIDSSSTACPVQGCWWLECTPAVLGGEVGYNLD